MQSSYLRDISSTDDRLQPRVTRSGRKIGVAGVKASGARHGVLAALFRAIVMILPWPLKRKILTRVYGYELHPTSRIGYSWIFPEHLELGECATIGHLNFSKGLELIALGAHATIGNLNWITAHPLGGVHFRHRPERRPALVMGEHAAITSQHFFDCASSITIGSFSTVAGLRSQFFTHSIDVFECRQDCDPIEIGAYCLVATGSIVLPGSCLPDYSVASACSLLNKRFTESYYLYGGTPGGPIKQLSKDCGYFRRTRGYVT
jgi:acetyltransferase-like isoleucine patch superfamily enzyme